MKNVFLMSAAVFFLLTSCSLFNRDPWIIFATTGNDVIMGIGTGSTSTNFRYVRSQRFESGVSINSYEHFLSEGTYTIMYQSHDGGLWSSWKVPSDTSIYTFQKNKSYTVKYNGSTSVSVSID